jgi:hypothetical protein
MEKGTKPAGKAGRNHERHRQTSEGELEDEWYVAGARDNYYGFEVRLTLQAKTNITEPGTPQAYDVWHMLSNRRKGACTHIVCTIQYLSYHA